MMINTWVQSPYFGVLMSLLFFVVGEYFFKRIPIPIFMPLVFAIICMIGLLSVTGISYESYNIGGKFLSFWITPATISLAISLEKNMTYLKAYYKEILIGIASGVVFQTLLIIVFCVIFKFQYEMVATLIPKHITTPIAMGVTETLGGIVPLTVAIVVFTGVIGAAIGPTVMKICRIDHPVAQGIAMGAASHAMGTAKAIEMGETQGAMSGLAIVVTGLIMIIVSPLAQVILNWIF